MNDHDEHDAQDAQDAQDEQDARAWAAAVGGHAGSPFAFPEDEDEGDEYDDDEDEEYGDEYDGDEYDGDEYDEQDDDEGSWTAAALGGGGNGNGPTGAIGSTGSTSGGGADRRSGRAARIVVLVVLLGLLAAGIALDRREPEVAAARVTTAGLDGPEIPVDDAVSTAWYCAAGASAGDAAQETVFVGNLSPAEITATVTVDPGGDADARTTELRIRPYERSSLEVSDVVAAESPGVVVEVAGGSAVVEHEIRREDDVATSVCARAPSPRWFFAAGATEPGQTQVLELFNPFGGDAVVDIAFLTEGGVQEPQALQGFVVARRSKVRVPITDLVARQERVATVVRTRTGRVVAEQVRTFDGTGGIRGLTLSLGAASPRQTWTLPTTSGGGGTVGGVAIANFGLEPTSVEVSMLLEGDGVLAPETIDVPSRAVVRFDPSDRIAAGTAYTIVVRSQSDVPVVAEALVGGPSGSATSTGASVAARQWTFAGAPDDTSAAVIAVNVGTAPLTVELRAYTAGAPTGPRSAPAIAVEPGRTVRFDLDEWGIDTDQVLVVSADGPIVAGRETYAGGVSLSLGVPVRD